MTNVCSHTIKGHLLSHPGYSAISVLGSRQKTTYHILCLNLRAVGTGNYQRECGFAKYHVVRDMMDWWVATWCFGMFSKTPWSPIHNASPSISVLTVSLKLADIIGPGSSMYNCTQIYCFNPHEPCAPLIGRVLRFAQFPTLYQKILIKVIQFIQKL